MEPSTNRFSEVEFEQLLAAASRAKEQPQNLLLIPARADEVPEEKPSSDAPPKQPC